MDAVNPAELQVLSRLVLTTTTGSVQLWQQDQHQWTREESLTDVRVAEMVELPEPLVIASQVGAEETESFGSRLQRQLADAQVSPIGAALSRSFPDPPPPSCRISRNMLSTSSEGLQQAPTHQLHPP